jgi:hypothetical protein
MRERISDATLFQEPMCLTIRVRSFGAKMKQQDQTPEDTITIKTHFLMLLTEKLHCKIVSAVANNN